MPIAERAAPAIRTECWEGGAVSASPSFFGKDSMEEKIELTASNIRFLLTVKRMLDGGEQPKGFRLAEALQCTRPSVHKMTKYLDAKALLRYENHSVPTLTEEGARIAEQYSTYYYAIADSLPRELVDDRVVSKAICALLAELPEGALASALHPASA